MSRLILDVAANGVVQPLRLINALVACNNKSRILFSDKNVRAAFEDVGSTIRIGLGQIKILQEGTARDRCLCNVPRVDGLVNCALRCFVA